MTPGARIQTSIDLFCKADASTMPFDFIVGGFFRGKRYVGSKDRRSISERIFGGLRRRARQDWWIDQNVSLPESGEERTRARLIADLILVDGESADSVNTLFSGGRHCPTELSDKERQLAAALNGNALDHPDMPSWVSLEYPEWLHDSLDSVWGDRLVSQMNAMNESAPLDLRVNTLKTDRDSARQALLAEGIEANDTPISPLGLRVHRRLRLGGIEPFRKGFIEVQDEGSQLVSLLADVEPGMTVVDYCAGGGGKTLALGAAMQNKGNLFACDISSKRLGRLGDRTKRAGLTGIRTIDLSSDNVNKQLPKHADRVLLDVPCSGTGTWRRNPDAKWRLDAKMLERHTERQSAILEQAAPMVKPGGRMVYITCSVLPEENEHQVDSFLDRNQGYAAVPIAGIWNEKLGASCPTNSDYLRLTPADHQTDGFFCAVLERSA